MDDFRDWQLSKEAQKRLEKLCSQMPDENIEQVDPALAWLFRSVMENIVKNDVEQASSSVSTSDIYYEPDMCEIYSDEFYNRYTKIQRDAKEKSNIKEESKMETNVDPVNSDLDDLELVETKKKSVESKMDVNEPTEHVDIEETVCLLVNKLNVNDEEEMADVEGLIRGLPETDLAAAISQCWSQLSNDAIRINFCSALAKDNLYIVTLCRSALLPWVETGLGSTIEPLSKIMTYFPNVACKEVIMPLLSSEISPLVNDLFALKDLMANMKPEHWALILREFVSTVGSELQKWHIPVLTVLIEQSLPEKKHIHDVLNQVVSLMVAVVHHFAENRDFGSLMIAVIQCLDHDSPTQLVNHTAIIVQRYKGTLRFKATKLIKLISK